MGVAKRNRSEDKLTTNSQCQEFNIDKKLWIKFGTYPYPLRFASTNVKKFFDKTRKKLKR